MVEGQRPALVQIVVRAAVSVAVDVFHLGPSAIPGVALAFQTRLLPGKHRL